MVYVEAELVAMRTNRRIATEATLNQLAIASGMGAKKAHKQLSKTIDKLTG